MLIPKEMASESYKVSARINNTAAAIATYARSLVPTLRDAGREHSAKELERLLFEYDVAIEEAGKFLTDNIAILLGGAGKP